MRIFEFCSFLNENRTVEIKIKENFYWVDQLHILEVNKTYSYDDKDFNFDRTLLNDKAIYHPYDVKNIFRKVEDKPQYYDIHASHKRNFDIWYWKLLNNNGVFFNESVQRNLCTNLLKDLIDDEDIIILSDLDEIIDNRYADKIISEVKKHQIITIKLYYSVFFLNLFCSSNDGAPFFSYRVFIMTGRYFKNMPFTSDYLRKKGFEKMLYKNIYCLDEPVGFHHSWLEYEKTSELKAWSYKGHYVDKKGLSQDYLNKCINNKKLYYMKTKLYIDNNKKFLRSLKEIDTNGLFYE